VLLATLLAGSLALTTGPAGAVEAVASFHTLPTGNGHGFSVFDVNQNAITHFLAHPYRYLRPNPANPDGDGIVRRNLVFDAYFGVRTATRSVWLGKRTADEVGYVDQTGVIRSQSALGPILTESFFFAPYGYDGNALVMVLVVTNTGASAAAVDGFVLANFHMGSAPNPDAPQADGESLQYDAAAGAAVETGPGGGALVYAPLGDVDRASCADGMVQAVQGGQDLTVQHSCSGNDRVQTFQRALGPLAPGASASFAVAVLYAEDGDADATLAAWDAFAAGRDGQTLVADALAEWEAWRTPMPGGLGADEQRVWRQGEAVLRMGQVLEPWSASPKRKNHGMILASLPPGGWHSGWLRDAAYALVALARSGHHAEAKQGLTFFLDAEAGKYASYLGGVDYRLTTVRYFGNGEEEADYSGQPTRNIEIDGWGLYLWAARVYVDESGDTAWLGETTRKGDTVYHAIRAGVAEALAGNLEPSGMAIADASIWEVHWGNRQHFLYTTAAAARGFCDMAALARRAGELGDRDRYQALSADAIAAMRAHFVDQNGVLAGSLEKLAQGQSYRDGAVIEAFTWELIPTGDAIAAATLDAFSHLQTPAGGYKRVEGSSDPYDTDEWILIDLRAADVFHRAGRNQRAATLLDWVTAQASRNYDLIPELYNTRSESGAIGAYAGSIPMVGYGPGAYLLTVLGRAGSYEHRDCGTVDPESYPDAGTLDFPDAGAGASGDADLGGERTGTACLCRSAGSTGGAGAMAGAAGPWLWALWALVGPRRRRQRRWPRRRR
jgi:hypothetical protein